MRGYVAPMCCVGPVGQARGSGYVQLSNGNMRIEQPSFGASPWRDGRDCLRGGTRKASAYVVYD